MGNRASAERACKDPNPIIDGRKANVNLAILGAKPRGNITSGKSFILIQMVRVFYLYVFLSFKLVPISFQTTYKTLRGVVIFRFFYVSFLGAHIYDETFESTEFTQK